MAIYEWDYIGKTIKTPYEIVTCKDETHLCLDPYKHPETWCGLDARKHTLMKEESTEKITCKRCLKSKMANIINERNGYTETL